MALNTCCGPLVWENLTDSGPHGIYVYSLDQELHYGDWCVVKLPCSVMKLGVDEGYKLIKKVSAFEGDTYEVSNNKLIVNGVSYPITRVDYLPQIKNGQYIVPANHHLYLNDYHLSFDSRYFGPVSKDNLQCKVILICDYDKLNQWIAKLRSWFA